MSHPAQPRLERRTTPALECRVKGDSKKIEGYAAVFDRLSLDMGFQERIAPGAFATALGGSDVRAMFNHDPNYVLGRQKAGTLTLTEDDTGLLMSVQPSDAQWVRDLVIAIERRDIDGMSFSFTTKRDHWAKVDDMWVRTLLEIDELVDVGPVTFPAYPDTTVAARGLALAQQQEPASGDAAYLAGLAHRSRQLALRGKILLRGLP